MSALEEEAIPIVSLLVKGETTKLRREEQLVVGRWIAKATMLLEAPDDDADRLSSETDRSNLMRGKPPPEDWRIFIGDSDSEVWKAAYSQLAGPAALSATKDEDMPTKNNFQLTAFGIGRLFAFAAIVRIPGLDPSFHPHHDVARQLWPIDTVPMHSPPRKRLSEQHIANLLDGRPLTRIKVRGS